MVNCELFRAPSTDLLLLDISRDPNTPHPVTDGRPSPGSITRSYTVFYMHISLPSASSRPRVRLRCSRRPDHSFSKSSFALLGASRPRIQDSIHSLSSVSAPSEAVLFRPVTFAMAKPTPITSGIPESHLVLARPGNWKIIEALPDRPSLRSFFLRFFFLFFLFSHLFAGIPSGN